MTSDEDIVNFGLMSGLLLLVTAISTFTGILSVDIGGCLCFCLMVCVTCGFGAMTTRLHEQNRYRAAAYKH